MYCLGFRVAGFLGLGFEFGFSEDPVVIALGIRRGR